MALDMEIGIPEDDLPFVEDAISDEEAGLSVDDPHMSVKESLEPQEAGQGETGDG